MCRSSSHIVLYAILCMFCRGQQYQPPRFVHPPNPTVLYGIRSRTTEIRINCEAEGQPTVKYRWLKNNQDFERQGHPSTIHTTGPLTLHVSGDDQVGLYQCVAYNDLGSAYDRPVRVEFAYMDMFPVSRQEIVQVHEGSSFKRECKPPSSNPPTKTFWLLSGRRNIAHHALVSINSSNIVTNDMGTLFFQRISEQDANPNFFYTCAAENPALREYKFGPKFAFSIVKRTAPSPDEPSIQYSSPKDVRALKGTDVNLYCVYSGSALTIVWKKNGANFPPAGVAHEVQKGGKVLRLKNVNASDEGEYSCIFPDAALLNRQFNVTIDEPPSWKTVAPESATSKLGDTVEYDCNAAGKPAPSVKFYKNGAELPQSENYQINGSKLKIVNVKLNNVAVYQCNVSNVHGYVSSNFYLNLSNQ